MASAPERKRLILAVAITAIIALLVGAGGVWLARSAEVADLESRLADANRRLAEIAETGEAIAGDNDANAGGADDEADPGSDESPDVSVGGDEEPATETPVGESEEVAAIVTGVRTSGGTHYVTLDYIQFLTGDAAAAAAEARGDESPPPNDYYIVNENPRLREFALPPSATVRVIHGDDASLIVEGRSITVAEWVALATGSDRAVHRSNFYWVTVEDGTITSLEQQYLP
jgi:hypothetical protein